MEKRVYKELNEIMYSERLNNGLTVKMIPKSDYSSVYAALSTTYGSVDHIFKSKRDNKFKEYPYGVAHFLEHKLFETEKGDISQTFSSQGASVNAFTSNTMTAFMCSFTTNKRKNIETLMDFVQIPFFDQKSVEDEKNIISQEIMMYKDDPDWALTQGLIENLYPCHPIRVDVAGTPESILSITVDILKENYDAFYHPQNMQMIIVGNIDPSETLQWIKKNQENKSYPESLDFERKKQEEGVKHITKSKEVYLPVNMPKVAVGIKGDSYNLSEEQAFRHIICMEILLDLIFGETSATYLSFYNGDLIDDSFGYDYIFERGFDYVSIGGDTRYPEDLAENIKNILLDVSINPDVTPEHFSLIKKKMIGEFIQNLNSLDYIAHQFIDLPFTEISIFDYLSLLRSVTLEDVKNVAKNYFKIERLSVFTVRSRDQK